MNTNPKRFSIYILLLITLFSFSCTDYQKGTEEETHHGLDLTNIDSTISPADDFFAFVNGNWIKNTEIPADQGRWGSFNELREDNNDVVLEVLKKAGANEQYADGSDQRKAADFFSVGMDSLLAESVGTKPLQPIFDQIAGITNTQDLQEYLAEQETYGGGAFFSFFILADLKNSKKMAAYLGQGGMGLPDRDYYTKTDEKSEEIKAKYVKHIARMLGLLGDTPEDAARQADNIMALETRLANASLTNVERRNIPLLYNKMSLDQLTEINPSINWKAYLTDLGVSEDTLIVTAPKFMEEFEAILKSTPIDQWKEYLRWSAINGAAGYLNHEFVSANFDFYGKELRGTEEMRPRWKRVLGMASGALGEAIGKLYVDETFPPEAKENALKMVDNIKVAFGERIRQLDWMSDSTKEMALKKLSTFTVKIGYPDEWRDYSGLVVEKEAEKASYIQNVMNATKFGFDYQISKLGKPVNKKEWQMTPQTVNAYYNPLNNEIVFPAAILQPPFYDYKADEALNYGGIGAVIGHEISHGFDDQGSRFDADGNLRNWWSEEDLTKFKGKTTLLAEQYSGYEALDSVFVNGEFTLGENIGDLGGISVAYDGLQRHLKENGRPENIDGLTPEQRFFMSWGTIWRIKYRDETLRTQINTDPHSPGMFRANGPISNMEEFYQAFNVQPGDGMYRADSVRVKIW
ncbi:M13 family metallopeptidase [Fulvivirgaceae bacterium BMA10]|uniref:M13 family metallopeptidase n=1 Tax=Splendidivirga corallicola TaxID=3051826 RepID=A0ABT8KJB3_9BACT|nr:M13 family metallopeptidase [Fulvivirgaceae bacterium BMA10]